MMKKLLLSLAFVLTSASVLASAYPPDYTWAVNQQEIGVAKIAKLYNGNMQINYYGPLRGKIYAWVKLNGQSTGNQVLELKRDRDGFLGTGPKYCTLDRNSPTYRQICDQPSDLEKHVFLYAKNDRGILNVWDVEISFVNELGQWDSNGGKNYKLRLE